MEKSKFFSFAEGRENEKQCNEHRRNNRVRREESGKYLH